MLSAYDLPIEERDQIMSTLNSEQAAFLNETMTRGRRTVFARIMAGQKGSNIPENATYEEIERLVEDWIYINYVDAGAVSDHLKCECGRSLRYQHTVQNKTTGQTHKFGITHLEMHTGIDAKIVNHIVHGFQTIDFELYEILFKVKNGWNLQQGIGFIPPAFLFPEDVQRHLDLDVPLLDRQINRVRRLIRVFQSSVPPIVKKIERKTDSGQPNVAFEGDQSVMNLFVDDSP
ncbi:MAG: hypothetical protein K0Q73_4023, partial [Paenibacillus sp.]|nr:hypothetical protein [Paenibacillus sp.]